MRLRVPGLWVGGMAEDAESILQATDVAATYISDTTIDLTWVRGDRGAVAVFVKAAATGTAGPANNTVYAADANFGDGDEIGSSDWFCVYNGTGEYVRVTGLTPGTYSVHACEYTDEGGGVIEYLIDAADGNPLVFEYEEGGTGDEDGPEGDSTVPLTMTLGAVPTDAATWFYLSKYLGGWFRFLFTTTEGDQYLEWVSASTRHTRQLCEIATAAMPTTTRAILSTSFLRYRVGSFAPSGHQLRFSRWVDTHVSSYVDDASGNTAAFAKVASAPQFANPTHGIGDAGTIKTIPLLSVVVRTQILQVIQGVTGDDFWATGIKFLADDGVSDPPAEMFDSIRREAAAPERIELVLFFLVPATVTTVAPPAAIQDVSAVLQGSVSDCGGSTLSQRLILVSATNPTPTVDGVGVTAFDAGSGGEGVYQITATGLTTDTLYYYRAATIQSAAGIPDYGDVEQFTTAETIQPITNITVDQITATSARISWTKGTEDERLVVLKPTDTGEPAPLDNTSYDDNVTNAPFPPDTMTTRYVPPSELPGSNDEVPTGWACIFNSLPTFGIGGGDCIHLIVSGLNPNTAYRVAVVAYDGGEGTEAYNLVFTESENIVNFETLALAAGAGGDRPHNRRPRGGRPHAQRPHTGLRGD